MQRLVKPFVSALAVSIGLALLALSAAPALAGTGGMPRYKHIFVIYEENHSASQILGNPNAPVLNQLASTYGQATDYFGTSHPSEGNYVAPLGGWDYGITNDAPYTTNVINAPSLASQLEAKGMSWKSYQQSLPFAGFTGTCYPCNATDPSSLYASKHNGFVNFASVQDNPAEMQKTVPIEQLNTDLANGTVPNFSFIVPDQCHDMHGTNDCPTDSVNVKTADTYAGQLVTSIMSSPTWKVGQNAIVVTFDEGTDNAGCCDANPGGGQVYNTVITNHGPLGVRYAAPSNHYSLLLTVQQAFGLSCLQFTCDSLNVKPMTPLFATE